MIIYFIFPFVFLYCGLILYFTIGNLRYRPKKKDAPQQKVSLIIPFRNEVENLPKLISALNNLDFPKAKLEIIFVDDHSEDNGSDIVREKMKEFQWRIISLQEGEGKKLALKAGITASKNELIVTTDADCSMQAGWLKSMAGYFEAENPHLLLGAVVFNSAPTVFKSLQQLEFAALMASTAGAVAQQKAFMANGANLAFRRATYLHLTAEELVMNQASGDDVFLLHALKNKYQKSAKICFANDRNALVYTDAIDSLSEFVQQRIRWGGKAKHYTDGFTIFVSVVVLLGNVVLPLLLLFSFLGLVHWMYFAIYFLLKWIVDSSLISSIVKWRGFPINPIYTLLLTFIYPFYFILLALLSLRFKAGWKGRKL